ncbi:MAG TPA: hypothetical protein PK323_03595 [Bacteroidia bacterium]|nr:hypothetical protein [Bacteroidia bacterium]
MKGLYYNIEVAENTTISLLRFYENGYVIYKKIVGNKKDYIARELKMFSMNGHIVNGEREYTYCGAFEYNDNKISFKIENEIINSSNSWVQKDVLSFKGSIINDHELLLKSVSKRTKLETENSYLKITEQELLDKL